MKKAFLQKVVYRQMVANIFSEEYIFFSDFINHIFLLGIVLKKRRANLSDVAKERVKTGLTRTCVPKPRSITRLHLLTKTANNYSFVGVIVRDFHQQNPFKRVIKNREQLPLMWGLIFYITCLKG
jgi:hypothetical protein